MPIRRTASFLCCTGKKGIQRLLCRLGCRNGRRINRIVKQVVTSRLVYSRFFSKVSLVIPIPLRRHGGHLEKCGRDRYLTEKISIIANVPVSAGIIVEDECASARARGKRCTE